MAEIETFAEQLEAIEHYKALGHERIVLPHDATDQPWDRVTAVKPGGTHRFDMETSLNFEYAHPDGVTFVWFVDGESRDANGSGSYKFEVERLAGIFAQLPDGPAAQLREYFERAANAVQAQGDEYMEHARRQYGDAAVLRSLVS